MLTLSAKIREITGKKNKTIRKKGFLPAVLYGPKIKSLSLEINTKDFERIFNEAGKSSLIKIEIEGKPKKEFEVLIHEIQKDHIDDRPVHIDFYLPPATKEIEVKVPIIIEGEAPAVKELGGTLVRDIHEIEIKGLIQNLPKEIRIDISQLKTFNDHILVKDLVVPVGVKILKDSQEIVVSIALPEKIEEELEKPAEEKVEEVEVVEKGKEPSFSEATEGEEEKKEVKK